MEIAKTKRLTFDTLENRAKVEEKIQRLKQSLQGPERLEAQLKNLYLQARVTDGRRAAADLKAIEERKQAEFWDVEIVAFESVLESLKR